MSIPLALAVGILGGIGALARHLLDAAITRRARSPFPYGILAVNLSGALALGVLAGATHDTDTLRLVGGGLLGAYTTFSTWMLHSHRLGPRLGALNIAVSLVLGLAAVWLGRELGMAM